MAVYGNIKGGENSINGLLTLPAMRLMFRTPWREGPVAQLVEQLTFNQ